MDITQPLDIGFTIYSKSGCYYCAKVKQLLKEKKHFFFEIVCDDYLITDREQFLLFIKDRSGKEYKTFPMVFFNSAFIGGYNETKEYFDKLEIKIDDNEELNF